jgi:hypothetical protein
MSINSFFNTVSVPRYSFPITVTRGVEKTVDTHTILINAIKFYGGLQEI